MGSEVAYPLIVMAIGIVIVISMIIVLKVNAFLALITAALAVSLLAPGDLGIKISRVADAFGSLAGKIGIVIALAAIIGKCMMDSGAADRIVRAFLAVLGEKRAPFALTGSGFVLAVPVFFDTVFYLLVPLARSLYRRTGSNYLMYLLAIGAGAAITHTLVPPTPGPLVMAEILNFDVGVMIFVGVLVAIPASLAGIVYAKIADRVMPIEMRELSHTKEPDPLPDDRLPGLFVSLLPIVLPIAMISVKTILEPIVLVDQPTAESISLSTAEIAAQAATGNTPEIEAVAASSWDGLLQFAYLLGDANFALFISTIIALWLYFKQRKPTLTQLGEAMEDALMSGGVIILITAGGGAFGAMLKVANVGDAISTLFALEGGGEVGRSMMLLGFFIAVLLKVAQGSSTVAMITTSGMLAAVVTDAGALPFHPVYLATSIGAGSLVGSWMNDSGFWIFAKMGGLTEVEGLKTWTPLLTITGIVSLIASLALSFVWPFPFGQSG